MTQPSVSVSAQPDLGEWPSMWSLRTFSGQSVLFLAARATTLVVLCVLTWSAGDTTLFAVAVAALVIDLTHTGLQFLIQIRGLFLQRWIKELVAGNLDYRVVMDGKDEITMYARVLEALRQSLVRSRDLEREQRALSEELRAKNETLSETLDTLRTTQDQIVSQQKLAELGELSAGVAHEIRNPLQFIKNFAHSSGLLVQELTGLLERPGALQGEELKADVAEVSGDLSDNMRRIGDHSARANRIVSDMLDLGREGSQEFRRVDLNRLLVEQATLACQAVRAKNGELAVAVEEDLDPDLGEVSVVPRDVGRVFVNIVTNACHALAEKRKGDTGFEPSLRLRTRRSDEAVEVSIRDNGIGMSPEVLAKMFNPFFTTKEPDEGTGLGMSLSHDVVRQHGGTLTPESVPGEYTEMKLRLPARNGSAAGA